MSLTVLYRLLVKTSVPNKKTKTAKSQTGKTMGSVLPKEVKYFDTALAFAADATAEVPATGQLNIIPQNDTDTGRDGRAVVVKSIEVRGTWQHLPGAAALAGTVVHMYLVLDKQCNKAAAAVLDVFTTANIHSSGLNMYNRSRFQIMKHWTFKFEPKAGVTTAYNQSFESVEYTRKCRIPITWDNSAATGALNTTTSNNLFLICGAFGDDDLATFTGNCRLLFDDV